MTFVDMVRAILSEINDRTPESELTPFTQLGTDDANAIIGGMPAEWNHVETLIHTGRTMAERGWSSLTISLTYDLHNRVESHLHTAWATMRSPPR